MAEPFLAEIRIFPYSYAPRYWAFCNGQTLNVSQNAALYSLLGINYGGNGTTNFKLPDLIGRAPMHPGQGYGLTGRTLGQQGGSREVTLTEAQLPAHNHGMQVSSEAAESASPEGNVLAVADKGIFSDSTQPSTPLHPSTLQPVGGGVAHNNMMPYITLNFCICMQGIYPSRS